MIAGANQIVAKKCTAGGNTEERAHVNPVWRKSLLVEYSQQIIVLAMAVPHVLVGAPFCQWIPGINGYLGTNPIPDDCLLRNALTQTRSCDMEKIR